MLERRRASVPKRSGQKKSNRNLFCKYFFVECVSARVSFLFSPFVTFFFSSFYSIIVGKTLLCHLLFEGVFHYVRKRSCFFFSTVFFFFFVPCVITRFYISFCKYIAGALNVARLLSGFRRTTKVFIVTRQSASFFSFFFIYVVNIFCVFTRLSFLAVVLISLFHFHSLKWN